MKFTSSTKSLGQERLAASQHQPPASLVFKKKERGGGGAELAQRFQQLQVIDVKKSFYTTESIETANPGS